MNATRLYKKTELKFDPDGRVPGKSSLARIIGPEVSQTIGAEVFYALYPVDWAQRRENAKP